MLRIRLLRISQGMTLFDLGHAAGISQGRLSMLERGLVEPTAEERERLAQVLKVSGSSLFRSALRERRRTEEKMAGAV